MYQPVAQDLRKKWNEEQEQFVRQNYDGNGSKLVNVLPFSSSAIRNKAKRVGVQNNQHFHHVAKTELPKVSETDLQYAAGFIDGEGSFYQTYCRSIVSKMSVGNSNKDVINWLHKTFGMGKVRIQKPRKKQHLPAYIWILERQGDVWAFTEKIWPYLKVKQKDAKDILGYLEAKHQKKFQVLQNKNAVSI